MTAARASRTAEIAAAVRAAHLRYDRPVVFADPYALELTSAPWRTVCRHPLLHGVVVRRLLADFRSIHAQMLGRARYAEDELLRALGAGVGQYVLIGAGLDSFALRRRDLADRLAVFELDQPAGQAIKRARLAAIADEPLRHVDYVAADLEVETVAGALQRSRYDPSEPAFFTWLGTTYYLSGPAIVTTLRSISGCAAPGSELVLDFALPAERQPPAERRAFLKAQAAVERRGEPWHSFFEPAEFARLAEYCGFEVVDMVTPDDLRRRYFVGRADGLLPPAWGHLAHLRLPG